jgi:hypothetical protein
MTETVKEQRADPPLRGSGDDISDKIEDLRVC